MRRVAGSKSAAGFSRTGFLASTVWSIDSLSFVRSLTKATFLLGNLHLDERVDPAKCSTEAIMVALKQQRVKRKKSRNGCVGDPESD